MTDEHRAQDTGLFFCFYVFMEVTINTKTKATYGKRRRRNTTQHKTQDYFFFFFGFFFFFFLDFFFFFFFFWGVYK